MLKIFLVTNAQDINEIRKQVPDIDDTPVYILKDGKFFRTAFHPSGWSDMPDYDLGNDGLIYRTVNHPDGFGDLPDYEFGRDKKLYRTHNHPKGTRETPEYEVRD